MKEKNYRSLVKSISYRITGTITTFLISLVVTGKMEFALSIMSVDFVSKIATFSMDKKGYYQWRADIMEHQLNVTTNTLKRANIADHYRDYSGYAKSIIKANKSAAHKY